MRAGANVVAVIGRSALVPDVAGPIPDAWASPELPPDLRLRLLGTDLERRPDGMSRWPRLDRYARALTVASADATGGKAGSETGMFVASQLSCLETNAEFDRGLIEKGPALASPKLFPYTLPGSGASEAAMHLGLGGAYLVFTGGPATALAATLSATDQLAIGPDPRLLVVGADVLGAHTLRSRFTMDGPPSPQAPVQSEAGAGLWLGQPQDPLPGPRVVLDGVLGTADPHEGDWGDLVDGALSRTHLGIRDLSAVFLATTNSNAYGTAAAALESAGTDQIPVNMTWRLGDCGAVASLLAIGAALDDNHAALILASDPSGSAAVVIAPSPH